jgi:hypothetical protein
LDVPLYGRRSLGSSTAAATEAVFTEMAIILRALPPDLWIALPSPWTIMANWLWIRVRSLPEVMEGWENLETIFGSKGKGGF